MHRTFFARIGSDGEHQRLSEHIHNVSEASAHFGRHHGFASTCRLGGLLHDLGKYSDEYQEYLSECRLARINGLDPALPRVDHGVYGAKYLWEMSKRTPWADKRWFKLLRDVLAMCVAYHHGGLEDYVTLSGEFPLIRRQMKLEVKDLEKVAQRFHEDCYSRVEIERLADDASDEIYLFFIKVKESITRYEGFSTNTALFFLIKMIYSMLIDADRLDAYNFNSDEKQETETTILNSLDRFHASYEEHIKPLQSAPTKSDSEKRVQELRYIISKDCVRASTRNTGIYTLSGPTGSGKTLASTRFALRHIKHHAGQETEKHRIIYVAPYTTIIEQNAAVIREALACDDSELLEHHSAVTFTEKAAENEDKYKLLTERWNCPIIFMTQVQFFNALYAGGTQSVRRLHALTNSVIIFDEAQTIPLHLTYLANAAFNSLAEQWNSTILLCTATQPRLDTLKTPLFLDTDAEIIRKPSKLFKSFERMNIIDKMKSGGYTFTELADFVQTIATDHASILIVMNTKNGVKRLFDEISAIKSEHEVVYLTTYLCAAHRRRIISELKAKLDAGKKVIIVSTNLVECGVNISVDVVIRNLAGLASIVQSSGRGNRHGKVEKSVTYIVNVEESIGGLEDLKIGQRCLQDLLLDYADKPSAFNNSLLSQEANDTYFDYFMNDPKVRSKLGFPVKVEGLRQTLDLHQLVFEMLPELRRQVQKHECSISIPFRFIADHFVVIEDLTHTIVVPFDENANQCISTILSDDFTLKEKRRMLTKIQSYCVNVYDSDLRRFISDNKLIKVPDMENVYALKDGEYSQTLGILEGGVMDLAMM